MGKEQIISISEETHAFMTSFKIFSACVSKIVVDILKDFEEKDHKGNCFKFTKSLTFLMQMTG